MDIISTKKDDDILDFLKKVIKENSDCKIYLSGDYARKFLIYARMKKADAEADERVGDSVILRSYHFDDGMGTIDEIKIKDDLNDREKFQVVSLLSSYENEHYIYTYSRNCEKKCVQNKEILIVDKPYIKTRDEKWNKRLAGFEISRKNSGINFPLFFVLVWK